MTYEKLRGEVVLNRDNVPCIKSSDGSLFPPIMTLYTKFSSRNVDGAKDGDFRAFQAGYLKEKRGFGLRSTIRAFLDTDFAQDMNNYMRFYEAGLEAREGLEKKVGQTVEL